MMSHCTAPHCTTHTGPQAARAALGRGGETGGVRTSLLARAAAYCAQVRGEGGRQPDQLIASCSGGRAALAAAGE